MQESNDQRPRGGKHQRIEHTGDTVGNYARDAGGVELSWREPGDGEADAETALAGGIDGGAKLPECLEISRCDVEMNPLSEDAIAPRRVPDGVQRALGVDRAQCCRRRVTLAACALRHISIPSQHESECWVAGTVTVSVQSPRNPGSAGKTWCVAVSLVSRSRSHVKSSLCDCSRRPAEFVIATVSREEPGLGEGSAESGAERAGRCGVAGSEVGRIEDDL